MTSLVLHFFLCDSRLVLKLAYYNLVKCVCILKFGAFRYYILLVLDREMVVVFDCIVGHSICVGCFVEYMERTLNDRGFVEDRQHGYTIKCPGITKM